MQLILLSKDRGHLGHVRLTSGRVWLGLVAATLLVAATAFYGGITAARAFGISSPQAAQVETWRQELAEQQAVVDTTRRSLQQHIDALALRIGQMNAHVVRLDALGARLTQMAGLKDGEFDFTTAPSLGGPEEPLADAEAMQINGVVGALDVLEEVVAAVDERAEVYIDGGVRRGLDAAIAVALGARAVFIGRPVLYALAVDGAAGVTHLLELLHAELASAMALLGAPSLSDLRRAHVV